MRMMKEKIYTYGKEGRENWGRSLEVTQKEGGGSKENQREDRLQFDV